MSFLNPCYAVWFSKGKNVGMCIPLKISSAAAMLNKQHIPRGKSFNYFYVLRKIQNQWNGMDQRKWIL